MCPTCSSTCGCSRRGKTCGSRLRCCTVSDNRNDRVPIRASTVVCPSCRCLPYLGDEEDKAVSTPCPLEALTHAPLCIHEHSNSMYAALAFKSQSIEFRFTIFPLKHRLIGSSYPKKQRHIIHARVGGWRTQAAILPFVFDSTYRTTHGVQNSTNPSNFKA